MDGDTIIGIVWGVLLVGILISIYFAYRRRRRRTKRVLIMDLLKQYFEGGMPTKQLGQRTREIASHRFTQSAEFFSLAIAAFQGAVDAKREHQPHSEEDERKLLSLLAAVKKEFGLTDLYQIEAWRPGRE